VTTAGPKIDIEEIKKLNDATSKADIARTFGKPAIPQVTPNGVEVWTYSYAEEPGAANRWKGATRAVSFFFRADELRGYTLYSWDTINAQESTPKVISWVSEREKTEVDSSPTVATASVAAAPKDPMAPTEVLKGNVSSTPTGARIFVVSENETERPLGTTPQEVQLYYTFLSGPIYLVFKLDGYLTGCLRLDPGFRDVDCSTNFDLLKDHTPEVAAEKQGYSKEFAKRVVDVVGAIEKVLSSPTNMAGAALSDAKTEYAKLTIDFPEKKESALFKSLAVLVAEAGKIPSLQSSDYDSPLGSYTIGNIGDGIRAIKAALSVAVP
jgi:hypothetical protein